MSKLSSRVASALSFAHLAGIGSARGKNARAEDEDDERKNDAEDDDNGDGEDRDNGKRSRKAKGSKAGDDANDDDDSDDNRAEDDDLEDEGGDDKKSRRAKGKASADEEDDDADAEDDEDEMHGKSAVAQARRRERARCAAIFGSRFAAKNPVLAATLAFNTSMTRQQALAALRDTSGGSSQANGRADRNPQLGTGEDHAPSRQATIASRWDRAMSKMPGR